ncbi:DUF1842 domain-containing protein [Burkholderia plantarii]|nr:DUF1842 domain-containing protein [Burkholderia plantarii]
MGRIMSEFHLFNHAGVFSIGTPNLAGGRHLQVFLSVPQATNRASGYGTLTQATNPPLHIESAFLGSVYSLGLANGQQVYALQGTAVPPIPGAPHVTELVITLDSVWGKVGKAAYKYVIGSHFEEVVNQPVAVQWLLQNGERAA